MASDKPRGVFLLFGVTYNRALDAAHIDDQRAAPEIGPVQQIRNKGE